MRLRNDKRQKRRDAADDRQAEYDSLSASEKIAKLDKLLGVGLGAKKERARLAGKLGAETAIQAEKSVKKEKKQTKKSQIT